VPAITTLNYYERLLSQIPGAQSGLDFEMVALRVDAGRDAVAIIGRSASFARIAKGAPVPEFKPETATAAGLAPCDDHLKMLWIPVKALAHRLGNQNAPWVSNLPADREIVASRFDAARGAVGLVIRSPLFPLIRKGAAIPEFEPILHGMRWGRW